MLEQRDRGLLTKIGIHENEKYEVCWFNNGFQNAEDELVFTDIPNSNNHEYVKKWDDKSVGKGCDIIINFENGKKIYLEVKTSKRTYPYFNMTSVEMQEMEKKSEEYVLIKVNNIEKLLLDKSPDVIVITNPFDKLFHPNRMKEATFLIGGKEDE